MCCVYSLSQSLSTFLMETVAEKKEKNGNLYVPSDLKGGDKCSNLTSNFTPTTNILLCLLLTALIPFNNHIALCYHGNFIFYVFFPQLIWVSRCSSKSCQRSYSWMESCNLKLMEKSLFEYGGDVCSKPQST